MVCLSALLAACGKQEQTVRPQPVVRVARAETIASEAARSYTFISEPVRVTQLAFRVGGPVEDFTVQAGQFFRQGQPIAAIDRRGFLIPRDPAEALFRQGEAEYRRTAHLFEKNSVLAHAYGKDSS